MPSCQEDQCLNAALYQCPRCAWRSCSLQCCQAHKKRSGCNGKRDRTRFVSINRMDDHTMNSDYFFLEDVLQQVESGKRLLRQVGDNNSNGTSRRSQEQQQRHGNKRLRMHLDEADEKEATSDGGGPSGAPPQHIILQSANRSNSDRVTGSISAAMTSSSAFGANADLKGPATSENQITTTTTTTARRQQRPSEKQQQQYIQHPKWRFLVQQAAIRGIQLLLMPCGMTRHKENKSFYRRKSNSISWTTEWFCYPDTGAATTPTRILLELDETAVLGNTLEQRIRPQLTTTTATPNEDNYQNNNNSHSNYMLLMKRLPCSARQPIYVAVMSTSTTRQEQQQTTLADALRDMTIVEYPTLYIVPHSRKDEFPLMVAAEETTTQPVDE